MPFYGKIYKTIMQPSEEICLMYTIIEKQDNQYIELLPGMEPISSEEDALQLVSLCYENDIYLVMLSSEHLSTDFFDLHTGLAGKIMLKLSMHGIKVVALVNSEQVGDGRFAEMAMEGNHFNNFGFFYAKEQAEEWLFRS